MIDIKFIKKFFCGEYNIPNNHDIFMFLSRHDNFSDVIECGGKYFCKNGYTYDDNRDGTFVMSDFVMTLADKVAYDGWKTIGSIYKYDDNDLFDVIQANGKKKNGVKYRSIKKQITNDDSDVLILKKVCNKG